MRSPLIATDPPKCWLLEALGLTSVVSVTDPEEAKDTTAGTNANRKAVKASMMMRRSDAINFSQRIFGGLRNIIKSFLNYRSRRRILAIELLDVSDFLGKDLIKKTLKAEAAVLT